ncbi:rhamnosyl/mannosyltransferase [Janibacter indicus]|uniref:D-inositol 3-phosphate glycosyltransferase n=2 Tax=Janibacter indicus TaxID=857417 RepID=A0A1W1ZQI7_9MICO|nr:rhamnosyl/mannosyltransferase [Janibacter indicus]
MMAPVGGAKGASVSKGRPRRVALIASSYHPYVGGVEEHVRQLARELHRQGVSAEVWTVDRGEHLGEQAVDGITVRYLPTPLPAAQVGAVLRFVAALPVAARSWSRAMRQFRPDVLHVHCFGPNGVYALAAHAIARTPLVVTTHGETFADDHGAYDRSALLRMALRRSVVRAVAVTAPAEFVLADLRARFGLREGVVVPNGIDPHPQAMEPVDLPPGRPVVLGVGRVEHMKGFDLLLDAAADPRLAGVQVVIGGDGTDAERLRALARAAGISERVHLLGRLSPRQVATAMSHADVVVVPSRREAFGLVALEAWRAGTPLVGTVHGGMPEFVSDGVDGVLVDPIDSSALAGAVAALLADPVTAAALAAAGSARCEEFSWQAVADLYCDLYEAGGRDA